jgi:glycosyltransferase involved in cell wall biosynthesis
MVHDYPPLTGGGLALGVQDIAAGLDDVLTFRVLSSRARDHFADDRPRLALLDRRDAHVCTLSTPRRALSWLRDADVVVVNWTFSFRGLSTLMLMAAPLLGKPTVLVVHTAPDHCRYNRMRRLPAGVRKSLVALAGAAARRCSAVVALSRAHAAALARVGFPAARVIPLPVAGERYGNALNGRDGRPIRTVVILGELSELKGADTIPRLLPVITSRFDLRIVGRGPLAGLVTAAAAALPPARRANVIISDAVDPSAVPQLFSEADCVLVLSRSESQCRVALEAMLSGVVVLARAVGGVHDLIPDDAASGFLIDPDKPESVHDVLLRLANDPAEAERVRRRARAHASRMCARSRSEWRRLLLRLSGQTLSARPEDRPPLCAGDERGRPMGNRGRPDRG